MCGRFSLGADTDRLIAEFGLGDTAMDHAPLFNIAPTQPVLAAVLGPEGLRLGTLRWGLVPPWARDPSGAARLINARSETVHRRRAFADAFRRRRCWILADGFYEWRREPGGRRVPHYFQLPGGRPFAFAGLWERWGSGDAGLTTCTLLTTEPNDVVRPYHDRMPVILPAEARDRWLDPEASAPDLAALLRPFPHPMAVHAVSDRVNSPANDDPACSAPLETSPPPPCT